MLAAVPAQARRVQTITVNDPGSGAFSIMTNAVTFGAATTDKIVLLPECTLPRRWERRRSIR